MAFAALQSTQAVAILTDWRVIHILTWNGDLGALNSEDKIWHLCLTFKTPKDNFLIIQLKGLELAIVGTHNLLGKKNQVGASIGNSGYFDPLSGRMKGPVAFGRVNRRISDFAGVGFFVDDAEGVFPV